MSYELHIGWRYIYRGLRDRRMLVAALLALAATAVGFGWVLTSEGPSPFGVITVISGLFATIACLLLAFFSVFTTVAIKGVVFGVAALTVVLAVTTGFQEAFREKVLGVNAHVIVMKTSNEFGNYKEVMETAAKIDKQVLAVQPFIFSEMLVTNGRGVTSGVAIKGVDPDRAANVLDLEKHMVEGSVSLLGRPRGERELPPIILGRELAAKLKVAVNEPLTIVVPLSDDGGFRPRTAAPRTKKFVVAGVFYSGFDEYDRRLMYVSLADAQALVNRDDVMAIELKVADVDRAAAVADKLRAVLGEPQYQIQDWYELNANLFTALTLQKVVLLFILTLIIAVATFNVVASLTMMVTDKTREIAILKSMGATSRSVAGVFQVVGITIGVIGTVSGLTLGLVTCHLVSGYGYRLDPRVYLIDRLPIKVEPLEVALVAGVTMAICLVATLFPASKASSLTPIEGLRYD